MTLAAHTRLERARTRLAAAGNLLARASPALRVSALQLRLAAGRRALSAAARSCVSRQTARLEAALRTLHAVSPLATLDRGYAIVTGPDGRVLVDATRIAPGEVVGARVARGRLTARVIALSGAVDGASATDTTE
jgi:exodeoxyribonuclease VII large subunit